MGKSVTMKVNESILMEFYYRIPQETFLKQYWTDKTNMLLSEFLLSELKKVNLAVGPSSKYSKSKKSLLKKKYSTPSQWKLTQFMDSVALHDSLDWRFWESQDTWERD